MAQTHYKTLFRKVLLGLITEQDPVLAMLEWVAQMMMQIEAERKVGAEKGKHTRDRKTYFSGDRQEANFFNECGGEDRQGDPAAQPCDWRVSQGRFLCPAGHVLPR
jgi:hypothetical protein